MAGHLWLPTVKHDRAHWGNLNYYGKRHVICAESMKINSENYSFLGGHRVRLYSVKGNVHWQIPADREVDISEVAPANSVRRR